MTTSRDNSLFQTNTRIRLTELSRYLGRWGIVYPELDGSIIPSGLDMFRKNKGKPGEVTVLVV